MKIKHDGQTVRFRCQGCGDEHRIPVTGPNSWSFNGDLNRPTLTPSVSVKSGHYAPSWSEGDPCWCGKNYPFHCYRCHFFVTNGRIEFQADCTHELAGKTVDLVEVE